MYSAEGVGQGDPGNNYQAGETVTIMCALGDLHLGGQGTPGLA